MCRLPPPSPLTWTPVRIFHQKTKSGFSHNRCELNWLWEENNHVEFQLKTKSVHIISLKQLDDFDGVLAHFLGLLHLLQLLQAALHLPQLWEQPHLEQRHELQFQAGSVRIRWKQNGQRGTFWHFQTTAYWNNLTESCKLVFFLLFSKPMKPHTILIMVTQGNHTAGFM